MLSVLEECDIIDAQRQPNGSRTASRTHEWHGKTMQIHVREHPKCIKKRTNGKKEMRDREKHYAVIENETVGEKRVCENRPAIGKAYRMALQ